VALTGKQERRVWRCLDYMKQNAPFNPADTAARTKRAAENRSAAGSLAGAVMDAVTGEGAHTVNEQITEAEDILGLERV
jgi:hypothetical protein